MSTLIISTNTKRALDYIQKDIENREGIRVNLVNNIDILCYNDKELKISTLLVRDINNRLSEKSLNLKNKYLILSNFNSATQEAQNAFLKNLEESSAKIYLIANSKSGILETALSRVFLVNLKFKKNTNKEIVNILDKIVYDKQLSLIKSLTSKHSFKKILNNLEIYIKVNSAKIEKEKQVNTLNKIYICKKRSVGVTLNSEIQLTNIILHII